MLFERFNRVRGKIYDAVVEKDVPFGWQSQVIAWRVIGFWPTEEDPNPNTHVLFIIYKLHELTVQFHFNQIY